MLLLYCFPHSGGSASFFQDWVTLLPPRVELRAVQLPGRENRFNEEPMTRIAAAVEGMAGEIGQAERAPFVFLGHSMGALLAYELSRWLRDRGRPGPRRLFVSACRAPHLPDLEPPISAAPTPEFVAELRRLNGMPAEVVEDEELMELLLPMLRADCEMSETYSYRPAPPLGCPITAFSGDSDELAPPELMRPWQEHTSAPFTIESYPGGHFFVQGSRREVLTSLRSHLERILVQLRPRSA